MAKRIESDGKWNVLVDKDGEPLAAGWCQFDLQDDGVKAQGGAAVLGYKDVDPTVQLKLKNARAARMDSHAALKASAIAKLTATLSDAERKALFGA